MRPEAINTYHNSRSPSFGLKLCKDAWFYRTQKLLNEMYSPESVEGFFKSLSSSDIGGEKNAINIKFFGSSDYYSNSYNYHCNSHVTKHVTKQVIRYSFWNNSEIEPTIPYYETVFPPHWANFANDLINLRGRILEDCKRFVSGEDDEIIQSKLRVVRKKEAEYFYHDLRFNLQRE